MSVIHFTKCYKKYMEEFSFNDIFLSNIYLYAIPKGFSLTTWTSDRHLQAAALPEYGLSELKEDLGVAMFVRENSCSQSTNFSSLTNGWAKG